jgi:nucleoside-diphosphate-sugar epimerase
MSSSPIIDLIKTQIDQSKLAHLSTFYKEKTVAVTGGASFIGSNLVELLSHLGAFVTVVDDFSSGKRSNLAGIPMIDVLVGDLKDRNFAMKSLANSQIIFNLAAVHGGRGFIETYKREMLVNLSIDNNVFAAASGGGKAEMVVHASSACAYPINLQEDEKDRNLLREFQASMEKPETSFADGVYGWTKLIGEYQLENHCMDGGMHGRSARIFTAYGERENESHAAVALVAKGLLQADPYPIWGNGQQTRNFTHVADTALGLLFLGSDQNRLPYDVFNVGTSDHVKVIDFVEEIFRQLEWQPSRIDFQLDKPTGVASRASDNTKIFASFGWEPKIAISTGIERTLDWYRDLPNRPRSISELEERLSSR